ncbi:MAG: type 1 glutamine amidotransferase [Ghiorsea sp.]
MFVKVHYLQHVSFEGLSCIESYLIGEGHVLTSTKLYLDEVLPSVDDFDWLIVMGGPMGIYDHDRYPWLVAEKDLIKQAIDAGKHVLGICLGAQLIADVLGARVYKGEHKEIGWFEIVSSLDLKTTIIDGAFPKTFEAFHWHSDTFDIPKGAIAVGASEACKHQGFVFGDKVVALQFHLETTPKRVAALIEHCSDELDGSTHVQSENKMMKGEMLAGERMADEMRVTEARFDPLNKLMFAVLDKMERGI